MSSEQERLSTLEANSLNMSEQIKDLKETVVNGFSELREDIRNNYVSQDSFLPVKLITYGLAGSILLTVLGAILLLVINK